MPSPFGSDQHECARHPSPSTRMSQVTSWPDSDVERQARCDSGRRQHRSLRSCMRPNHSENVLSVRQKKPIACTHLVQPILPKATNLLCGLIKRSRKARQQANEGSPCTPCCKRWHAHPDSDQAHKILSSQRIGCSSQTGSPGSRYVHF